MARWCGTRSRYRNGRGFTGRVVLDLGRIVAAVVLLAAPALAQSAGDATPDQDAIALCTTWQLVTQALKLARQVHATATDRADRARRLVQECEDRQCPREERIEAEQEVREAGYQQGRAKELAEAMEQRRTKLMTRFEELRGKDAIEKCDEVSR